MLLLGFLLASACAVAEARAFVNISGDVILGALFPIHRKGSGSENCGKIQLEDGIQPLEAMLYTLGQINRDPDILPGVRLGVLAFDSCDNPNYALEQALNFVKGFIAHVNEYHKTEFQCLDGSVPKFLGGGFDRVVAVLAAQSSSVTLQVASMLRLFSVPQISYMATTPSLSSKERFPHFFRTVPSDVNQAHAMLEILKQFEWTYVSVVYSDTEYGNHGYETLVSLASKYSICFSAPQRIDKERFSREDYDNVIRTIANKTEVRVVVLFAEKVTTLHVMDAARRLGVGTRFVWIGSDAWSTSNHRNFLNPGRRDEPEEVVLEGALAVQPLSRRMSGFDDYFASLTLAHEAVNPWFREFWREFHRCDEKNATEADSEDADYQEYERDVACSDEARQRIARRTGYKQQKFLHFVRDAVYSAAHALHDMFLDRCGQDYQGMCEAVEHIDGATLSKYLANVSFKDEAGNKFRFMNGVDGPPRYSILNYQRAEDGSYRWHVVGNYTQSENGSPVLQLDQRVMKYRSEEEGGRRFFPNSTCASPCQASQVKVREKQDPCCWRCRNCGLYQFKLDDHRCEDCEWGTRPTEDKTSCSAIPEEFIDYSSPWAVSAMAVATCGEYSSIPHSRLTVKKAKFNKSDLRRRHPADHIRALRVLAVQRDSDNQGLRPRALLPPAAGHTGLLPHDLRHHRPAQYPDLRDYAIRDRALLHALLLRPRHQDQQDPPHIQQRHQQPAQAEVHQSKISVDNNGHHHVHRGSDKRCVATEGATVRDLRLSDEGYALEDLPGLRRSLLHDRTDLSVHLNRGMHGVRSENAQMPRRVQRDALHRLHQLHDDDSLAGFRSSLPGLDEQRYSRGYPGAVTIPQRTRPARLPLLPQSLHRPHEAGEEHQGAGDGPPQKLVLPADAGNSGGHFEWKSLYLQRVG